MTNEQLKYFRSELSNLFELGLRISTCLEAASMGLTQAGERIERIVHALNEVKVVDKPGNSQ